MKPFKISIFLYFICALLPAATMAASQPPPPNFDFFKDNFRVIDSKGFAQSLFQYKTRDYVFLVSYSNGTKAAQRAYNYLKNKITPGQKLAALWIDSGMPQDRSRVNSEVEIITSMPVLMDFSQTISKSLNFETVGDVVVLEPKNWSLVYRGRIYDTSFDSFLAEKKIRTEPSYLADILKFVGYYDLQLLNDGRLNFRTYKFKASAPKLRKLLSKNCVHCHMMNKNTDYFRTVEDFANKAAMNRKVMRMYEMPAGGFDYYHDSLCRTKYLGKVAEDEISYLLNWFDQGAPFDPADGANRINLRNRLRRSLKQNAVEFKPNLHFQSKLETHIKPESKSFILTDQLAGPLKEDLYFTALTLDNNYSTAHHVSINYSKFPVNEIFKLTPNGYMRSEKGNYDIDREKKYTQTFIFGRDSYVRVAPKNTYYFVPKGSYIFSISHFASTGKHEVNKNRLSLMQVQKNDAFKKIKQETFNSSTFSVAPNSNSVVEFGYKFEEDASLYFVLAHMHYRGTGYKIFHVSEDNKKTLLCNSPFYLLDKNVFFAGLKENFPAPKGSRVVVEITYDNTADNVANPDPSAKIPQGLNPWDEEMAAAFISFL